MKTLWLVRHAKSAWDIPGITDIDRALNDRGYGDAHEMAKRVKKQVGSCLLVSSPAIRAMSTALIFARNFGIDASEIVVKTMLYDSGADNYRSVIAALPDEHDHVLLFGHNPVITDTANLLAGISVDDMPTACIVGITFEENSWKKAAASGGKLSLYDFPKNKREL